MLRSKEDTICALATPPGIGGISVIRVSGKDAFDIVSSIFKSKSELKTAQSHTIHYGYIYNNDDELIDTVTVAIFKAPNSYTGEDVAEISSHGGYLVVDSIIKSLIANGARLAEAGEFTKRAFLNGKLNLMQAEAVADIIHSSSVAGIRTAARQLYGGFNKRIMELRQDLIKIASLLELELDFADEDIELIDKNDILRIINETRNYCKELTDSYHSAQIMRSGYYVSIAGYPNSGKSTLFNAILKKERAIVSDMPGTTRDYLQETIFRNNIAINIFDTAGIRNTEDIIEIEGIRLAGNVLEQSDVILIINDITKGRKNSDNLVNAIKETYKTTILLLQNKIDLIDNSIDNQTDILPNEFLISAKKSIGIESVLAKIDELALNSIDRTKDILINQRHYLLLTDIIKNLDSAINAIKNNLENEIIAIDIREAIKKIGELTGEIWSDEILDFIFSKFCIGK